MRTMEIIRGNRSFARTISRSLSPKQRTLLDKELPQYIFNIVAQHDENVPIYLEIGSGMGDFLINEALNNPEKLYIGAEVYTNGIVRILDRIISDKISNILLWPYDVNLLLKQMPPGFFNGIYILFPDPWPKKRQIKRRLLNIESLKIIHAILKSGNTDTMNGFILFGSDIADYYNAVAAIVSSDTAWINANSIIDTKLMRNYNKTKYHRKAELAGRSPQFLCYMKNSSTQNNVYQEK